MCLEVELPAFNTVSHLSTVISAYSSATLFYYVFVAVVVVLSKRHDCCQDYRKLFFFKIKVIVRYECTQFIKVSDSLI